MLVVLGFLLTFCVVTEGAPISNCTDNNANSCTSGFPYSQTTKTNNTYISLIEGVIPAVCGEALDNGVKCLKNLGCLDNTTDSISSDRGQQALKMTLAAQMDGFTYICTDGKLALSQNLNCLRTGSSMNGLKQCDQDFKNRQGSNNSPSNTELCRLANNMLQCYKEATSVCGLDASRAFTTFAYKMIAYNYTPNGCNLANPAGQAGPAAFGESNSSTTFQSGSGTTPLQPGPGSSTTSDIWGWGPPVTTTSNPVGQPGVSTTTNNPWGQPAGVSTTTNSPWGQPPGVSTTTNNPWGQQPGSNTSTTYRPGMSTTTNSDFNTMWQPNTNKTRTGDNSAVANSQWFFATLTAVFLATILKY
jgi:hypothetical protein